MSSEPSHTTPRQQPRQPHRFGELVIELGLASESVVIECAVEVERLQQAGTPVSLGELLIRRGALTPQQVQQLLRVQRKELLVCRQCGTKANVREFRTDVAYRCRVCGGILVRPQKVTNVVSASEVATGVEMTEPPAPLPEVIDVRASQVRNTLSQGGMTTPGLGTGGRRAMTPPDKDRFIGKVLGNYAVKAMLGHGGMAAVYLAENVLIRKQVALKVLHQDLTANDAFLRRFFREARIAARLHHPNIVPVWDVCEHEGSYFLVMQYVKGMSMKDVLVKRGDAYSVSEATYWFMQVLDGVAHAHERGIVHRDLKPDNFMIARNGTLMISDFGVARADSIDLSEEQTRVTIGGQIVGTPHFMAPETLEHGTTSPLSDVYAIGVSLYLTTSGHMPYKASTLIDLTARVMMREPTPIREHMPDASQEFCDVVMWAVAKSPEKRCPSAEALRDELSRVVG